MRDLRFGRCAWVVAGMAIAAGGSQSLAGPGILGSAADFSVLGGTTVTNTGLSLVTTDLGVWPGTAITGFGPGIVLGSMHPGDAVAGQAQADLTVAYNFLAGLAPTQDLTGMDLGGMTLLPGVYSFSSSAFLTGTLTLDAQGDPNAQFVFQMGSTLITASDSIVTMINGGDPCEAYWQVGSSATLGTGTDFIGNIVALTSITLTTNASILDGRALARNGAVTMDSNFVDGICIPAPGAAIALGMAGLVSMARRRRSDLH